MLNEEKRYGETFILCPERKRQTSSRKNKSKE